MELFSKKIHIHFNPSHQSENLIEKTNIFRFQRFISRRPFCGTYRQLWNIWKVLFFYLFNYIYRIIELNKTYRRVAFPWEHSSYLLVLFSIRAVSNACNRSDEIYQQLLRGWGSIWRIDRIFWDKRFVRNATDIADRAILVSFSWKKRQSGMSKETVILVSKSSTDNFYSVVPFGIYFSVIWEVKFYQER